MHYNKEPGNDRKSPCHHNKPHKQLTVATCSTASDPLVHRGRHFGRAVFAFCNVRSLITNGLIRLGDAIDPELLGVK
jgi:hypothetical protein